MTGTGQSTAPPPGDEGWVVLGAADTILVAEDDATHFVHARLGSSGRDVPVLVADDGHRRTWAVAAVSDEPPVSGTRFVPAWELVSRLGPEDFALLSRARMLATWQRDHRFCGRCGSPTGTAPDEHAAVCGVCGLRSYPRISPVIIVRVTRGDEILLARPRRAGRALYSVLAGFVEAGEALEDTVVREIAEEVGIAVTDIAYFGSQPWPFPHALMVGFTAQWAGGEITADPGEIVDAGWYRRQALPEIPPHGSIARALIEDFLAARTTA